MLKQRRNKAMFSADFPSDILERDDVKNYFISLLESEELSAQKKYQKFIDFFRLQKELVIKIGEAGIQQQIGDEDEGKKALSIASQELNIWNPQKIIEDNKSSIKKALRWLKNNQKEQGLWGCEGENTWFTPWALICLVSAKEEGFLVDFDEFQLDKSLASLWDFLEAGNWQVGKELYRTSIVLISFFRLQDIDINCPQILKISSDYFNKVIDKCLCNINEAQNDNGSWYTDFKKPDIDDIGAVSLAIQVLERDRDNRFEKNIGYGINWLIRQQEQEQDGAVGSWKNQVCEPNVNKTCDALRALLIGKRLNICDQQDIENSINSAVRWLLSKETPLFEKAQITGWGWKAGIGTDEKQFTLENTCLTLETLVYTENENISLPLLVNNDQWLINQQQNQPENELHDGEWDYGLTGRVAHALISFYGKIKHDPLFETLTSKDRKNDKEAE
jgi:hypothetical protein